MELRVSALALWCAVALVARAAAYTVDCNPQITNCAALLGESAHNKEPSTPAHTTSTDTTTRPTTTRPTTTITSITRTIVPDTTTEESKPQPRLLNFSEEELQNFANALHNQTDEINKKIADLSDVTLDGDEEEPPRIIMDAKTKIADKFLSNLRAPFDPLLSINKDFHEVETCKEKDVTYAIGQTMNRGCEESCKCMVGGFFDCSERCKHPYIRIGKSLNDPLCFESPVDECCSIIACSTSTEMKSVQIEFCRYGNETYSQGAKWHIGCEQTCTCEKNSVITCQPRCNRLPPSEKCINVQDPADDCCEVQVCDVSQDVHEVLENTTSTTTTTTQSPRSEDLSSRAPMRPLVLPEPIGSIKVLQNNTVRVNLIHPNNTEDPIHLLLSNDGGKTFKDVELTYSKLILNLQGGKDYILKTKETGTKFNFTITAMDSMSEEKEVEEIIGCHQDGVFYAVGEEFHIGCTELCECTGKETHECAALVCPSNVGLELISKGCVRWAPSPPAEPPNCCPRSARCLSDGTCHYKGVPVPNWSEVPISLTGCEERCFCENGELDCQQICSPLPSVPPKTLRCPPMHRPAPVNMSDDDCCKQWGCEPNAQHGSGLNISTLDKNSFKGPYRVNLVTPHRTTLTTETTFLLTTRADFNDQTKFYKYSFPVKSFPIANKTFSMPLNPHDKSFKIHHSNTHPVHYENVGTKEEDFDNIDQSFQINTPHHQSVMNNVIPLRPISQDNSAKKIQNINPELHSTQKNPIKYLISHDGMHKIIEQPILKNKAKTYIGSASGKDSSESNNNFNIFVPFFNMKPEIPFQSGLKSNLQIASTNSYFQPANYISTTTPPTSSRDHLTSGKNLVTVLRTQDLKNTNFDYDFWSDGIKSQVSKMPNPYEILLRVPSKNNKQEKPDENSSAVDLESIVSQMEVESEMTRSFGRSADKNLTAAPGQVMMPPDSTHKPPTTQQQSFLPTISPEIHFPKEDIQDYDQNNIHHPVNPVVPGGIPGLPPGLNIPPYYGEDNKKLSVISLQSDSPTSVKMLFGLPPVLVGLKGSVDLRYTDKPDEDISQWYSQVFAPADEVLTTPRLEFRLTGLKPSTEYKIRGKLYLHNLPVEPESEVYAVRTQDQPTMPPVEEKRREIDSRLTVVEANDTSAHISWRHFSEDELQFIDGIQVRYRPVGTPIYSMTELLHHSKTLAELHSLRPGSRYEASLVLIPPPKATTELHDPGKVEFNTASYIDPYNWSVTVEAVTIGSIAAELTWRGIPSPPERWVRVYRAASTCGERDSSAEHDAFRLAHRDIMPKLTLTSLLPDSRCRVWLELFLTNGKVKTSNVLEIHTKSLDSPQPIDNEIEAASISGGRTAPRGDYYGALVVVGVVAALGAVTSLLLLLVVVRRHRPRSVPITSVPSAPRESSLPPYDNPAYKLELQQETMDL